MNSFWNGKRRFVALLMLLSGVFVALKVPPVIPVILLPGEKYPAGFDLPLLGRMTNTIMGSLLVWILLVLLAVYIARRRPKSGAEVPPGGFYNLFEALFEGLMGFVGGIASGPHFRLIFNMFMTIFLVVVLSNWQAVIPGVDSVGFIEPHVHEEYNASTGEFEYVTTDGYEIYRSVVGYALNGQCNWVSAADEAAADQAALASAETAATSVEADLVVEAALHEFEAAHGGDHADEGDDHADEGDDHADEGDDHADEGDDHADEGDEHVDTGRPAAAQEAYDAVLAARVAEKQARADRGCYTDVGPVPWAGGDDHGDDAGDEEHADDEHEEVHFEAHPSPSSEAAKYVPWVVLPFVRVPSTDLNMTLSLGIIAFIMIQYVGFKALGPGYLTKFFAFSTLFKSPLGAIDVIVGLLELIGDFAKILSFSFRLLGAMFAGAILLFVMSFLVPIMPWVFFLLEFFVGALQAFVFGLLTVIFMQLATISHHHDDEEHSEAH